MEERGEDCVHFRNPDEKSIRFYDCLCLSKYVVLYSVCCPQIGLWLKTDVQELAVRFHWTLLESGVLILMKRLLRQIQNKNYPYQHTLWNKPCRIGFNCASNGVYRSI